MPFLRKYLFQVSLHKKNPFDPYLGSARFSACINSSFFLTSSHLRVILARGPFVCECKVHYYSLLDKKSNVATPSINNPLIFDWIMLTLMCPDSHFCPSDFFYPYSRTYSLIFERGGKHWEGGGTLTWETNVDWLPLLRGLSEDWTYNRRRRRSDQLGHTGRGSHDCFLMSCFRNAHSARAHTKHPHARVSNQHMSLLCSLCVSSAAPWNPPWGSLHSHSPHSFTAKRRDAGLSGPLCFRLERTHSIPRSWGRITAGRLGSARRGRVTGNKRSIHSSVQTPDWCCQCLRDSGFQNNKKNPSVFLSSNELAIFSILALLLDMQVDSILSSHVFSSMHAIYYFVFPLLCLLCCIMDNLFWYILLSANEFLCYGYFKAYFWDLIYFFSVCYL